ncbi:MAG TPA: [protein-PII] uridylyltransferase [Nitrospirota bacterium]
MNGLDRQHTSICDEIKALLEKEGAIIRDAHFRGASGVEIVQRRTDLVDRALRGAYAGLAGRGAMPALLAVGGYGRGELNPHSDIDLMLLCRDETDRQRSPELLYLLWDAGLDVGYSVRTVKECVALARQDIKIRTSLLESRLIDGDAGLYASFLDAMRGEVFYWKAGEFVIEKVAERNTTRLKYGGSVYLREPNIKEGEGGLRDVHTALWVAFAHYRVSSLAELVSRGVVTEGQYTVFQRSRSFLWRLRNEMHYCSGRKNDHLTFDLQERAAKDFRYRDSAHLLSVERFMKSYFIHARNIREFSNLVITAALRKPVHRWFERTRTIGPFKLVGRTVFLAGDEVCGRDPALIMTAFEVAHSRHAVLSDKLKAQIRACRIDDGVRSSPAAFAAFRSILNNPDGLAETLTLMKDLRVLGRYLPEFRAIQALARHDYYHQYTVDEHILHAIKALQGLWSGKYPALATLLDAFRGISRLWVLNLAVLLHDLGKAYRDDHERWGAALARRVLARMGVEGDDRERILFLVENHLAMAALSQRRELSDRKVISGFAALVRDRENLAMLYLLTYADISAVNPTAWTQWKAALLQDLYLKTLNHFDASAGSAKGYQTRLIEASVRIRDAAAGLFTSEEIDAFLVSMSDQYILTTATSRVIDHLGMMKRLPREELVIQHRHYREKGYTELTVCAYDAYGMFYRTAGAIASKNLNILRAQVYTSRTGVMIDTFQITDSEGKLCDYEDAWESMRAELRAALTRRSRMPQPGVSVQAHALPGAVTPKVEFDNETSETFTIIDITARDRIGFLYLVTKTLYDLNLDIGSAKIVTEGSRIMDSFYVTDLLRKKITDSFRLENIRKSLMEVVG